jgi:ATP-dependent Clp protease ATP-binding subunit ClpA
MNSYNYTERLTKVLALANQEAQRFNHEYVGTEHLLLGLVKEGSGVASNVLINAGIDLRNLRIAIEKVVKSGPDMVTMGALPLTPRSKESLNRAIDEAKRLKHKYIGTEHLLLALIKDTDGLALQVLNGLGVDAFEIELEILNLLGAEIEVKMCNDSCNKKVCKKESECCQKTGGDCGLNHAIVEAVASLKKLSQKMIQCDKFEPVAPLLDMCLFLEEIKERDSDNESDADRFEQN